MKRAAPKTGEETAGTAGGRAEESETANVSEPKDGNVSESENGNVSVFENGNVSESETASPARTCSDSRTG